MTALTPATGHGINRSSVSPSRQPVGTAAVRLVTGILAVAAGLAIASVNLRTSALVRDFGRLALVVSICAITAGGIRRLSRPPSRLDLADRLLGVFFLAIALAAVGGVLLPGEGILNGTRVSKLERLGHTVADPTRGVGETYLSFALALLALYGGATMAVRARRPRPTNPGSDAPSAAPRAYLILFATGLLAHGVGIPTGSQDALVGRATAGGDGIRVLLSWGIPTAMAAAVACRHWGSRRLVLVSILGAVTLLTWGTRSPLLLISCAFGMRLANSGRRLGVRAALATGLVAYMFLAALVGISSWRGQTIRGERTSLGAEVASAFPSLLSRLPDSGLDTVDGYLLVRDVDRRLVQASPSDLSHALLGFVPRQIWPSKFEWLGVRVSQEYLGLGAAGIFLSGPGYIILIFGSLYWVPIVFAAVGALVAVVLSRLVRSASDASSVLPRAAVLLYGSLRFLSGGDAFDIFHTLGLIALLGAANISARGSLALVARRV